VFVTTSLSTNSKKKFHSASRITLFS